VLASISKMLFAVLAIMVVGGCATQPYRGYLSEESNNQKDQEVVRYDQIIDNPFAETGWGDTEQQGITFRTKKGDQSVEVMIPKKFDSDIEIPIQYSGNEKLKNSKDHGLDYSYHDSKPTVADREIASTFNSVGKFEDEKRKYDIEQSLGLQETDELPAMDRSYLAKIDIIKQLFRSNRFEAALIEVDQVIKEYPTNARLYEMRGTLLDRMGYKELAVRSWKQSLEFKPDQVALKKVVEKRELQRGVATEKVENR
jgi:tetratricopeptide (TPR) repeat protein